MRSKSGLTLRLAHYLTEVQRTFMLTCVLFMFSNSMSFSTVCRQVRDFGAGVGSVTSAPKYCKSKSASCPKIVIKKIIVKSDAKIYFSADCGHGWHFKSICTALWRNILKMKKESTWWVHICSMRSKNTRMLGRRANC